MVEQELGYPLYEAVAQVKRDLSSAKAAHFSFSGAGLSIEADVTREDFERWISPDVDRIEEAVDRALSCAAVRPEEVDRVFLTGGTSLIPRIRCLFEDRFHRERVASGNELNSIAHGLALIGEEEDVAAWAA